MKFNLNDFMQLDTKALLAVNGGTHCGGESSYPCGGSSGSSSYGARGGGGSSGGGSSGGGSGGGGCSRFDLTPFINNTKKTSQTETSVSTSSGGGSCGGTHSSHGCQIPNYTENVMEQPTYSNQRSFSDTYGSKFGEHACAATSLLNEISEQYTAETGRALTREQVNSAMAAAVNSGNISRSNANVNSWENAANDMAHAVGLEGTYTYIYGGSSGAARIYVVDTGNTKYPRHFVSDIGNGHYYDPSTGQTGNVSDLNLSATGYLGSTRDLTYTTRH